ncbi:MAG: hypothetical protein KA354_07835 [Phycisphaerae bacterium]|nr:hypothetical protein [Phycisphaerae bacterium]
MRRRRTGWLSFLADLVIRIHPNRPTRDDADRRARRFEYGTGASRLGLRMTDWLRARLRLRWLRLRSERRV